MNIRRDPDLNRELLAEPVFKTGAIPDYAIAAGRIREIRGAFLSVSKKKWARPDSNWGPSRCKRDVIATKLRAHAGDE